MKALLSLLCFCLIFCSVYGVFDPAFNEVEESFATREITIPRDIDRDACAAAQMNFYWNHHNQEDTATPRFAQMYFFPNGTFNDISYNYSGTWTLFGENGEHILSFHYPSAKYVSPANDGNGSMISHNVCGYWTFTNFKWYCPSVCST